VNPPVPEAQGLARPRSLRWRLLAATMAAGATAVLLAGLVLAGLFREQVLRQFEQTLTAQLDLLTARLDFDVEGRPRLDAADAGDPRWARPYGGWYWQLDAAGAQPRRGVLRSRSLWDAELAAPADTLSPGLVHVHETVGPGGVTLLVVERTVQPDAGGGPWRLLVAADLTQTAAAVERFNGALAASLAALFALLAAAAAAQVAVGLAPLKRLRESLRALHEGRSQRLQGRFPAEVHGLVQDFNAVLGRHDAVVERARTQAGNLAHALKTPLATLVQAAEASQRQPDALAALPALVQEQVALARRHVDWHLARARAAAAHALPGTRTDVAPVLEGLARAMRRLHAARGLEIAVEVAVAGPVGRRGQAVAFAGESQDLHEMLGNLMDNACQWASRRVRVHVTTAGPGPAQRLRFVVDDDGPGIAEPQREAALARGGRLDERTPGSGLGLAIVQELAGLYGGGLGLERAPEGGLRAVLELPAAPAGTDSARGG
jgi:signal transduction histidine kinase